MLQESLRGQRGEPIRTGAEAARVAPRRPTHAPPRAQQETDSTIGVLEWGLLAEKGRRRFQQRDRAVAAAQRSLLRTRRKLNDKFVRNVQLTALRRELMLERCARKAADDVSPALSPDAREGPERTRTAGRALKLKY